MEFKFTKQEYQTQAAAAITDVFLGQPKQAPALYVRDLGSGVNATGQFLLHADNSDGYSNAPLELDNATLLSNIHQVQVRNKIVQSEALHHDLGACELDIEMETGTGKTYVYTKTIFELNRLYGWTKFIVVVPSVAIREGAAKSLKTTERHFAEEYDGKRIYWFVYDSNRLNELDAFASRNDISAMVINMQAFNSSFDKSKSVAGRGGNDAARRMFSERDEFGSRRPVDVLAATNPILILDEPQKMGKKNSATRKAMKQFSPLFSLNFSATHAEHHNEVFALDALDAYNMRLVKRIEVKGFELQGELGTSGYLYLQDIKVSPNKAPVAVIEHDRRTATGCVKRKLTSFNESDSIYTASGELEAYHDDFVVGEIVPEQPGVTGHVRLRNGLILKLGQVFGDSTVDDLRRVQIRETIKSHLEKEEALYKKGIKCLSLFFIDEVAKYRAYDDDGAELTVGYGKLFEQEYKEAVRERLSTPRIGDEAADSYVGYLSRFSASEVHKGYFSIDKKGRAVDKISSTGAVAKLTRKDLEEGVSDESAYDLILKNKERLLSFEEPTRFIFSHSALREGWDNPNVFQICTLKESGSETSKRQEVGRGMRLCVNRHGDRQDANTLGKELVQEINLLTVIASESYSSYVADLQKGIKAALRTNRPKKVTADLFVGMRVTNGSGVEITFTQEDSQEIFAVLVKHELITTKGEPTDKLRNEGLQSVSPDELGEHLSDYIEQIETIVKSVEDPKQLEKLIKNGFDPKIKSNKLNDNFHKKEFQALWKRINHKCAYTVAFDDSELETTAIKNLNDHLIVSHVNYKVVQGVQQVSGTEQQITTGEHFNVSSTDTRALDAGEIHVAYDLLGEIAERAKITRKSAANILQGINKQVFDQFKKNPEEFIAKAAKIIVDAKATMIVEHITYTQTSETYDESLFTETMPQSLKCVLESKKSVQDYVVADGLAEKNSGEYQFAKELETNESVVVYAKLPRGFKIPTPVGDYAPDWAIAFKEGSVKHMYFIAETKGSMESMQLRAVEQAKTACARKLFESLEDADIKYGVVHTYEDLLNAMHM